jgi:hypothetical protein
MCEQHFGFRHTLAPPPQQEAQVISDVGLTICNRTLMLDRETFRVFCVPFDFSEPIYRPPGSLLAGVLLRQTKFKKTILLEDDVDETRQQQPPVHIGKEDSKYMLTRLRRLMVGDMPNEATTITFTEFIMYDALMWCSDTDSPAVGKLWLAQQLNVWFNSPEWFKPNPESDVCTFKVALLDGIVVDNGDTSRDNQRFKPIIAPSVENTLLRYPRGAYTITVPPSTTVGIGHFLPLLDDKGNDWMAMHKLRDVRLFRMYRTQYPFIYTLMPDNDDMVRELKNKLKTSTESNPNICEKGKESISLHTSTTTPKYAPLVVTIPTLECERFVRAVFRTTPKYQYRLFYCARYDDENGYSSWIPVMANA